MVNETISPYPTYQPDKSTGILLASVVGISLLALIIQSLRARFQSRRLVVLIALGHVTIFIELILRVVLCSKTRQSKRYFITSTILLALCQRLIVFANNIFLIQANNSNVHRSRMIILISILIIVISGILVAIAAAFSSNIRTIYSSFRLRQVSSILIVIKVITFYPLWFFTRTERSTSIFAIILLTISSIGSLIVAIFLTFTSFPKYSQPVNENEEWCYYFQLIPLAFVLCTWTILHPKRSLITPIAPPRETLMEDVDNRL